MANKENREIDPAFNPIKASVTELKDFLRDKGFPVSGTKPSLVKRAVGLLNLGTESVQIVRKRDELEERQRHVDRFVTPLGELLPPPTCLKVGWTDNLGMFPPFSDNELYNYMVLSKQRTCDGESNNARRQLKAKVFYEDRHVHSVLCHQIDEESSHSYVKCKVIPSLPGQKQTDYDVWLLLSKVTGRVHSAGCTCVAGEGESCNHVAALLYALVDISTKKEAGLDASTSSQCKWNMPRKRKLSPKLSQELEFTKVKVSEDCIGKRNCVKKLFKTTDNEITAVPVNIEKFANKLQKCNPHAVWLLSLKKNNLQKVAQTTEKITSFVPFMYRDSVDLKSAACKDQFKVHFEELKCSQHQATKIENETRGQTKNEKWKEQRKGLVTSSNFGLICKRKETTPPENAIKIVCGYSTFTSASVEWGRKHEAAARRKYLLSQQVSHHGLKVSQCGLFINPAYPHLGASPDGIVHCDCTHCVGGVVLEVKCPYKCRHLDPTEAAKDKTFFCTLQNGKVTLRKSHSYYFQVQGQMAVCGKKKCDFFVWTLQGFSCERIEFDETFWMECVQKLNDFYITFVIPEYYTNRVKREKCLY